MARVNSNPQVKESTSNDGLLSSKLNNLSISQRNSPVMPAMISSSDYYYGLDLNKLEHIAAISKNPIAPVKKKKEKPKKERKVTKVESMTGKLKNLSITVKNEQSKSPLKDGPNTKELVNQLKMLQTGKLTAESLMKTSQDVPKIKKRDLRRRDEILKLNRKIQEKINESVKPKLMAIMSEKPKNGIINKKINTSGSQLESLGSLTPMSVPKMESLVPIKEALVPKTRALVSKPLVPAVQQMQSLVPSLLPSTSHYTSPSLNLIPKTKITVNSKVVELQRYTFEQLYDLQKFSTWELVPRLLELDICIRVLTPLDEFILKLLPLSETDRSWAILRKAEEKKFIEWRDGKFVYKQPEFTRNTDVPLKFDTKPNFFPQLDEKQKKLSDYVECFRLIANNDEELNKLIYQHEFSQLFENELKDQDLNSMSNEDLVKYLLDNNLAYVLEGEIRVNQRNNQEAYVTHKKGMKDVCINKIILRKHAFQGDYVRVLVKKDTTDDDLVANNSQLNESSEELLDEDAAPLEASSETRNFGCVLEILEKRHSRRVIGSFAKLVNVKKKKHLMIVVRDTRIPNVRVSIRDGIPTDVELNDKLLLTVEITNWNHDQPQGKVLSIIGNKGQLKTENVAILQQNNLNPVPFEQKIIDQLPDEPFVIPASEFEYREDLRTKCIFSIDPDSARDLDDALSCEVLENGNLEVGVHISDVSYFVKENSELDNIVKEKATTIYLVDTVYHMLPEKLCFLCSLLPGSDKLAYSVFFEMNPDTAEIYKTRYTRSIVNSCAKLSYDHAQAIIDSKTKNWTELVVDFPEIFNNFTVSQIADVITKLQKLAIVLRCNRKANGALKIDQPKLSFKFSKDDQRMEAPVDFSKYCIKDSNRLIEEFMLLANIHVAKFIYEKFPEISLLRQHDPPNENALKKLVKVLNKNNVDLDTSSSAALSKSMESLIAFARYPSSMCTVINHMVSKTMTRARYLCSSSTENSEAFWHYALSTHIYTHFTSPIRRYADIMVHRVLNNALNYEQMTTRTADDIQELANVCNVQKYNAKLAGDDSSNLYFMHFIRSLKSKVMAAGVLGVYEFNLEIILIDTGHLVKVYYKNLQQNDDVIIKTFTNTSPPYVFLHLPQLQVSMRLEFGSEILAQVEIHNDKLVVNKIFYNQKAD